MRSQSLIPDVLDYLVARLTESMPNVLVTDGMPKPPQDQEPDLLCIGFTGEMGEPAIENTRNRQQVATHPDRETFEIANIASSWYGNDTDIKPVRDGAYRILNGVNDFLMKDQTLGQRVMRSRLMTDVVAQEQTQKGAVVTIRFVIQIDAYTR